MTPPPRWQYRLQSFTTALSLVQEGVALLRTRPLSPLETEGLSTRFAFTWELGRKLQKDYLEHTGVVLQTITPAAVIRAAGAARVIDDPATWMAALQARTQLAHTDGAAAVEAVMAPLLDRYLLALEQLAARLQREMPSP